MTIKEYALNLRKELLANPTELKAKEIASKINLQKTESGSYLSEQQKIEILGIIESGITINGKKSLYESDNSDYLKAVATINSLIKKK